MRTARSTAALVAAPMIALAVPVAVVATAGTAAAATTGTATVSILHAVPGLTVDVYANGQALVPGFTPGTLTDPQQLPTGSYDLAVYPAGADPATTQPAISANDVQVPAGANVTVVAHLSAEGAPTLTPFVNTPADLAAGQAELTVRHVAAAPAVDVRAGGQPALTGLTNPNEASATVPAGTVSADVVLAGTDQVAIGPADLTLPEGTETVVYAWGSAADGNLALATQQITAGAGAPTGVPSGSGGGAQDGLPGWVAGAGALALAGAGVAAVASRRARAAA
ncbi:hypothetical protein FHR75_003593 [Kineococcus radiotolerans]|uniref:DUF4397 domain-containing protein n=1 Tax=Kineococcus radiotolerans TaxID=131568 RepID=A0A7W4TQE8_KINRA|nr:DUF4397 domain-containing protein [Kineococcus radiotolerans]MBB2902757.1 hypothetical protein [Kineococcus radiotolerans]